MSNDAYVTCKRTLAQAQQGSKGQILDPKLPFSKISSEPCARFF